MGSRQHWGKSLPVGGSAGSSAESLGTSPFENEDPKAVAEGEMTPSLPGTQRACCCFSSSDSVTPWTVARQAPLSMGPSRREYGSGPLCPPSEDLPDPGIEPASYLCIGRQTLYR